MRKSPLRSRGPVTPSPSGKRTAEDERRSAPAFHVRAARPADDYDVLMCYQVFLGRNPENSFVIAEAKTQSIETMIRSFLGSREFADAVARPLGAGETLRHAALSPAPSAPQLAWLAGQLVLDEAQEAVLQGVTSWDGLVGFLSQFGTAENGAAAPAEAEAELEDAELASFSAISAAATAAAADAPAAAPVELHERIARIEGLLEELIRQWASVRDVVQPYTNAGAAGPSAPPVPKARARSARSAKGVRPGRLT